jgi:glycine/D-amino acid oxidase-like deaminating enzyme
VANQSDVTITRQNKDGTWVVIIPRNYDGGTVIGGTRDVGDWNPHPDERVRAQMLSNVKATYPQLLSDGEEFRVIRDVVGRRPTREGGARLEFESLEDKRIIHAYGLGGRGYECSWGVAEHVCASCHSC